VKISKIDSKAIAESSNIRISFNYARESSALFLTRYNEKCFIRLKDICFIQKGTSITEDLTEEGEVPVVAGGKTLAYYHSDSNREKDVITISASGANAGYINYWKIPIWASDCTTVRSKNDKKNLTKFIYHLLKVVQTDFFMLQKGASQPHVYPDDLQNIMIPEIPIEEQQAVLDAIFEKETEIAECKTNNCSVQSIIDLVFQREFNFDYKTFEALKKQRCYSSKQKYFSANPDLRFSVKFHRPAGKFVIDQLTSVPNKKIKYFLAEPIVLGASVTPKNYDEDGKYLYISMATIKNLEFDCNSASAVSDSYSESNLVKSVKKGDIILARSGEGSIGKVAMISKSEIKGIFADFTMRIRLDQYNPLFAYYYFRTVYFQYLVEIYKKGLGNNTNIFPTIIQEFPILDISLDEQERIVDEIQSEILKQDKIKNHIDQLQEKIDAIIIDAITTK